MKKSCLTAVIIGFLLFGSIGTYAQTTGPKLNQVELMKQFLGTWRAELSDGNSMILEFSAFGSAMVGKVKSTANGVTKDIILEIWGYDEKIDKIIVAEIFNYTPVIEIDVLWFASKNTLVGVFQKEISNPENASTKYKMEIKTPDVFLMITVKNNSTPAVITWNRVSN